MGLPEIRILFRQKADNAIQKGSRGMVAVLLEDETKEQFLTPYRRQKDIQDGDWTPDSLKLLKLAFKGGPQKVVAVRIKKEGSPTLEEALKDIEPLNLDYLVYPGYTDGDKETVTAFLGRVHEKGKKAKAVLPDCAADDPHIVNFATSSVTVLQDDDSTATYTGAQYCCRIAGILAGLPLTQSSTFYVLPEVVDCSLPEDADAAIDAGKLVIVFDREKYKIGRGVTSLVTTSDDRPEELKKIKIVEGMDVITHDIHETFEDAYVGKVVNSYDNKQMFVGAVNDYLARIQGSILDAEGENTVAVDPEANRAYLEEHGTDTEDMTEQELKEANTGSYLFLTGSCLFLDAMEDLTLQINM